MTTKEFQERSDLRIFLSYFKPHKKLFVLDMVCSLDVYKRQVSRLRGEILRYL